jgi:hypothetical protein
MLVLIELKTPQRKLVLDWSEMFILKKLLKYVFETNKTKK